MVDLEDLTVVFITYKRQNIILRNLEYWKSSGASILVLDGSPTKISDKVIKQYDALYFHLPVSAEQRLFAAGKFINTKFVMIAADDDFMLIDGVLECIKFLDLNKDYVAATGKAIGLEYKQGSLIVRDIYNSLPIFGNIERNGCWKRAISHFSKDKYINSTFYAVQRKECFLDLVSVFENQSELDGNLMELFVEFCIVFQGKTKIIDKVVWVRCFDIKPNWTTESITGEYNFKLINKDRDLINSLIDKYILSRNSKLPSKVRIFMFRLIIIDKHLYDLFKAPKFFNWCVILLPILYVNLLSHSENFFAIHLKNLLRLNYHSLKKINNKQKNKPIKTELTNINPINVDFDVISKILHKFDTGNK